MSLAVPALHKHEPNEDVVDFLRRMLARAESGEVVAVAIAAEQVGREIATGWAGDVSVFSMVGALEEAKRRLLEWRAEP